MPTKAWVVLAHSYFTESWRELSLKVTLNKLNTAWLLVIYLFLFCFCFFISYSSSKGSRPSSFTNPALMGSHTREFQTTVQKWFREGGKSSLHFPLPLVCLSWEEANRMNWIMVSHPRRQQAICLLSWETILGGGEKGSGTVMDWIERRQPSEPWKV